MIFIQQVIGWDVNRAFMRAGDVTHDASPFASELSEDGVRILNVAGDADFVCNFMVRFLPSYTKMM